MDLDLLKTTLDDAGEPAYRARQVWAWRRAARAATTTMTDLPAGAARAARRRASRSRR